MSSTTRLSTMFGIAALIVLLGVNLSHGPKLEAAAGNALSSHFTANGTSVLPSQWDGRRPLQGHRS